MLRKTLVAAGALAMLAGVAWAANNEFITGNINVGGQITQGGFVQGAPFGTFKNLLDNPAMLIQQRGTGAATCGTTSGVGITAYSADRWGFDVNVTSGAGTLTPATGTPTPPTGFAQELKLVKNSGALAQPVCAWQEVRSDKVAQAAGQNVMLSAWVAALAGLAADGGNNATLVILTGTTADQGLGVLRSAVGMTASPAITPVWTGLATTQSTVQPITTTYARVNNAPVVIPAAALEIAVGVCFTPSTQTGGATDGIAFTGVQLEVVPAGATAPSAYEFRPVTAEQQVAQRYYWQVSETNTTNFWNGSCDATNVPQVMVPLPVAMDATPTVTWTVGGFSLNLAGAANAAATGGAGSNLANATTGFINLSFTNTCTAGTTANLVGTNTTGKVTISADF